MSLFDLNRLLDWQFDGLSAVKEPAIVLFEFVKGDGFKILLDLFFLILFVLRRFYKCLKFYAFSRLRSRVEPAIESLEIVTANRLVLELDDAQLLVYKFVH